MALEGWDWFIKLDVYKRQARHCDEVVGSEALCLKTESGYRLIMRYQ